MARDSEVSETLGMTIPDLIDPLPLAPDLAGELRHSRGAVGRTLQALSALKHGTLLPGDLHPAEVVTLHARALVATTGSLPTTGMPGHHRGERPALPPVRAVLPAPAPTSPGGASASSRSADTALFGPPPSADEVAAAGHRSSEGRRLAEIAFLAASVPMTELAGHLSVQAAQVQNWADRDVLSWADHDGVRVVPLWQFAAGQLLDGVEDLRRTFPGDAVALAEWMDHPSPALDGQAPLAAMRTGRTREVLALVRGLTAW